MEIHSDILSKRSKRAMENKDLFNIFDGTQSGDPVDEILHLTETVNASVDVELIREIHHDLTAFFTGSHPHFQKNTLPYHNLRHSQKVVLATVRLFHGLHCNQIYITSDTLLKGILAAYFHDTGLLLLEGDTAGAGTEYLADHEARSILFLKRYVAQKGLSEDMARDCATIINYTNLSLDPAKLENHTNAIHIAGQIVGSADILAQMADRYYLECLPLLYDEQKAGGTSQHNSAMELLKHTSTFYHNVVIKRLTTAFSGTSDALRAHFRDRYTIDRDLYFENIDKNIDYLKKILLKCDTIECLEKYLKRRPPTT